jgi:hypothetical protein
MSGKTNLQEFDRALSEFVTAFLELVHAVAASVPDQGDATPKSGDTEPKAPEKEDTTALAAERDKQLEPVNIALDKLRGAVKAISEPALAVAPKKRLTGLEKQQEALVRATTAEELRAAVQNAPALVADIGLAEPDANAAVEAAKRVGAHREAVAKAIEAAAIDVAQTPPTDQGSLPKELESLRSRQTALDKTDGGTLEADARELEEDALALALRATAARELAQESETRRVALQQVDEGIAKVASAEVPITGTIAAKPTVDALVTLRQRRTTLADAAGLEAIKRENAGADALIKDIGSAETAAKRVATEWQQLGVRKSAVDVTLSQAKAFIGKLATKGDLDKKLAAAEGLVADLATAADLTTYSATMTQAEIAAAGLLAGSSASAAAEAGKRATDALAALGKTDGDFAAVSGAASPVGGELATLTADKLKADGLTDSGAQVKAYEDIEKKATPVAQEGDDLLQQWHNLGTSLGSAKLWIDALSGGAQATLLSDHGVAMSTYGGLPASADLKDLRKEVDALKIEAQRLYDEATQAASDERKTEVENKLLALAAVATVAPFDQWHADLEADKLRIDSLTDAATRENDYSSAATEIDAVLALKGEKDKVDTDVSNTRNWVDDVHGSERSRLQSEFAIVAADQANLDTETDRGVYQPECARIQSEVLRIYHDSVSFAQAEKVEKGLNSLVSDATKPPFSSWLSGLKSRQSTAGLITDAAARGNEYKALLQEIGKVQALKSNERTLDTDIENTQVWVNDAPDPDKAGFESTMAVLVADRKKLDALTDRGAYDTELARINAAIVALYHQGRAACAPAQAPKNLAALKKLVATFAKIKVPNPVGAEHSRLELELTSAGSLSGIPKSDKLVEIMDAADDALGAGTAKSDADRKVHMLGPLIDTLPETDRAPFRLECSNDIQTVAYQSACGEADIPKLIAKFKALEGDVDKIQAKINAKLASQLDVGAANDDVTKRLATVKKELDKIVDGTTFDDGNAKKDYTDEHTALVQRQVDAGKLTVVEAKKKELFALKEAAVDLLGRLKKADFTAKAKTPDGMAKIAREIAAFGRKTDDPAQQAICKAALEACFKLQVETPPGMSVNALPTIFKMFAKVPAEHLGHDKLTKLEYETDPDMGSSYYSDGGKKVVLNKIKGAIDTDAHYDMVDQSDPSKKVKVNYLKATTLHEIGHGVDAKNQIMAKNMAKDEFGGWKKETVDSVAQVVFDQWFKGLAATSGSPTAAELLEIVKGVLATGKPSKPTAMSASVWDKLTKTSDFQEGTQDCGNMRNPDKSPWDKPTVLSDGRCYHEGYAGDWFSYNGAQRATGVSNYQWRAPAEWFAELYALHHLKGKDVPQCVKADIMKKTT